MFSGKIGQTRTWATFVGALCGAVVATAVGIVWWKSHQPTRSAEDNSIYDACLVQQHGNTVACDAMMRWLLERERVATAALKEQAAKLLAAGFSKRDVVRWAEAQGFHGSAVSDATGISLQDYQQGNY
jgi:hypothetical protein